MLRLGVRNQLAMILALAIAAPLVASLRLPIASYGPEAERHAIATASRHSFVPGSKPALQVALDLASEHAATTDGFSYVVKSAYQTRHNKVTHVHLKQTLNGEEIVNGDLSVHVDGAGHVVAADSSFFRDQFGSPLIFARPGDSVPELSPSDAVAKLGRVFLPSSSNGFIADDMKESVVDDLAGEIFPGNTEKKPVHIVSNVRFAKDGEAQVQRKYMIVGNTLKPVYDVVIDFADHDNWVNAQVDTITGDVVAVTDWTRDASYNVFPIGVNDPEDGERKLMVNPEDKVASPKGWLFDADSTTEGNNVYAQANPKGRSDWKNNFRPSGVGSGSDLKFDFELNLNSEPNTYLNASITNLFYWNNIMHDLFYRYGFDEVSGNFQENNFGRGGKGNDAVIANAQDGSGMNNANFATPPDGSKPRMRMYVWSQTKPKRDGDLEAGIVIHEYSHGISIRLTGGPSNSMCLPDGEAGGMGEGWGDFHATLMRMRSDYTNKTEFGMGEYSAKRGIRPFPYSTNLKTNPHTYAWIKKPGYSGGYSVHAKGAVWASILYDVYWAFADKYGFDANWYSVTEKLEGNTPLAGNQKILLLIIDGMKLQPCRPSFVDARNAIMKADEVNFKGEDKCLLWQAFAKRGLGVNAKKGGDEDFTVPQECTSF